MLAAVRGTRHLITPIVFSRRAIGLNVRQYSGALPNESQVVICGGGIIGCSVAYHLAKLGWSDIVLLEKGRFDITMHNIAI